MNDDVNVKPQKKKKLRKIQWICFNLGKLYRHTHTYPHSSNNKNAIFRGKNFPSFVLMLNNIIHFIHTKNPSKYWYIHMKMLFEQGKKENYEMKKFFLTVFWFFLRISLLVDGKFQWCCSFRGIFKLLINYIICLFLCLKRNNYENFWNCYWCLFYVYVSVCLCIGMRACVILGPWNKNEYNGKV